MSRVPADAAGGSALTVHSRGAAYEAVANDDEEVDTELTALTRLSPIQSRLHGLPDNSPPGIEQLWKGDRVVSTPLTDTQKALGFSMGTLALGGFAFMGKVSWWWLVFELLVCVACYSSIKLSAKRYRMFAYFDSFDSVDELHSTDAAAWDVATKKFFLFVAIVLIPAGVLYLDWSSDIRASISFFDRGQYEYFSLQVAVLVLSALWQGYHAYQEMEDMGTAVLAVIQVLPLLLVFKSAYAFLGRNSVCTLGHYKLDLYCLGAYQVLNSVSFMEAITESTASAVIQLYATIHETYATSEKQLLIFSTSMSVMSISRATASIDKLGHVTWLYRDTALVKGTAPLSSLAFMFVTCYRLASTASRLLLFPLFQEVFHGEFRLRGVSFGAVLLWSFDFALQAGLCFVATRNTQKLPYALASTISPIEPVLHRGSPVFTTYIDLVQSIHCLECFGAIAAAIYIKGIDAISERLKDDMLLVQVFLASVILQGPIFLLLRTCFAHKSHTGAFSEEDLLMQVYPELDCADRRIPLSMLTSGWTEPPDVDLNNSYLGPLGCYILSLSLKFPTESKTITSITLTLNHIGDQGAKWLCEGLECNKSVTTVNVEMNGITAIGFEYIGGLLANSETLTELNCGGNRGGVDGMCSLAAGVKKNNGLRCLVAYAVGMVDAGARVLAEALHANTSLTIDKIYIQYNGIGPEGAEALVQAFVARKIKVGANPIGGNPFGDPDRYPDTYEDLRRRFQDVYGGGIGASGKAEDMRFFSGKACECFISEGEMIKRLERRYDQTS